VLGDHVVHDRGDALTGAGAVACPRCGRGSATWTFERDQGRAGCPCGEVIPYEFDDAPLVPISTTPRKPRQWNEDAQPTAFRATLQPSMRRLWLALPLVLLISLVQAGRMATVGAALGGVPGAVLAVAAVCAVIAWAISQQARRWTFAIEGGHFRAEARGHHTDIPLDHVQSFAVSLAPKRERKAADAGARFDLVVLRTDGGRVRVPLFVGDADEAQFVAERANALLATDGRTIDGDYRGQRIRVAEVDVAVAPATAVRVGDLDDDVVVPSEDAEAIDTPRATKA